MTIRIQLCKIEVGKGVPAGGREMTGYLDVSRWFWVGIGGVPPGVCVFSGETVRFIDANFPV